VSPVNFIDSLINSNSATTVNQSNIITSFLSNFLSIVGTGSGNSSTVVNHGVG